MGTAGSQHGEERANDVQKLLFQNSPSKRVRSVTLFLVVDSANATGLLVVVLRATRGDGRSHYPPGRPMKATILGLVALGCHYYWVLRLWLDFQSTRVPLRAIDWNGGSYWWRQSYDVTLLAPGFQRLALGMSPPLLCRL